MRRTPTLRVSLADRGQTTQDFAVGIGVFLLAMAFVFSFVPGALSAHTAGVSSGQVAQADRVADTVVAELSDSERPNAMDAAAFEATYGDEDALAAELGLRASGGHPVDRVNLTIVSLETGDPVTVDGRDATAGIEYDGGAAAGSARIVTLEAENGTVDGCDPACRLVVRIW